MFRKKNRQPVNNLDIRARDTLPRLLVRNARRYGDRKIALREKEFGIWQTFTWKDYLEHVRFFCLGLISLGLEKNDKVAMIGDNRPEWVFAELAAQCAGAVPLGIYQDSTPKEVGYVIDHSDAKFVVAEDQEQVDKILELRDSIPKVQRVIYTDPKGMRSYDDEFLLEFKKVEDLGRDLHARDPDLFRGVVSAGTGEDIALIAYTSGTTGLPKGSMLSHTNILKMAGNLIRVDPKYTDDEFVSFLPLPWIGEQMMSVGSALLVGFTVNFPEEPETVQENIREIGPNVMFSPPRIWENLAASVQVKIMDASPLKRLAFNLALPIGYKMADCSFEKRKPSLVLRIQYLLAYLLAFRALKDRLGFSRLRSASTGGAALGPDTFRFFHGLGVNLKQIYGQTEISGISCIHYDGDVNFDSVGKPIPETEIAISPDGEILSRSPSVFRGYYKNDEATAETVKDGWLHSGDAGHFTDDGHLVVIDRIKDVMQMSDRTMFSPQFIENKLKFSPYIKEAVVIGDQRKFITAIVNIDMEIVGKWAEKNRTSYTTYTDLSSKPVVYGLIEGEIRKVNLDLYRINKASVIAKFVLLYKELDADDDELTRTQKVRRGFIGERYRDVIEAMYTDMESVPIDTTIKFQDGRTTRIKTTVAVRTMN
ncbi:long-chain-fatty-acid--CoA ligase FadD15 [bacterium BMS3Abin14]|nr:long-chain-fatty-acid--CoA ligase FadD15 [bacterium BMS3Abin14]